MAQEIKKREYEEWLEFCQRVESATDIPVNEPFEQKQTRLKHLLKDENYNEFVKYYFPHYCDDGKTDCGYFHKDANSAISKDPNILAILEWPREHAKSVHADIIIPLRLKAKGELTGMVLVGKNQTDACNLLSDVQAELQHNKRYINDFGEQFSFGNWQDGDFTTKDGINFSGLGRQQSPRGMREREKRPNYCVIDDIDDDELVENTKRVKKVVKWIFGALYFALGIKGSRVVVSGNRIHPKSVLAHIVGDMKPGAPKREGIYHSKVFATEKPKGVKCYIDAGGQPAWKERYSIEELRRKIQKAGIYHKPEFYHESGVDGTIFKDSLIKWKTMPAKTWGKYKMVIGYFDPSFEDNPTSDYKAVGVWGLYISGSNEYEFHCLKKFVRQCDLDEPFDFMSQMDDAIQTGVGVIWYVERQFMNKPIREALKRHNNRRKAHRKKPLMIIPDARDKENKFTRIIKMSPEYLDGHVYYNLDEMNDADMIEGTEQLKGIEPGYRSADDSPDADEGAWYYLYPHIPDNDFQPIIRKRQHATGW